MTRSRRSAAVPGGVQAERILVPFDFSRAAARALDRAALIAAATRCEVHLLHVLPTHAARAAHERAAQALARAQALACDRMANGRRVPLQVRSGEPYVQIIQRAREIGAELIVLGRDRAPAPLGTTLTRVVHMSDVPTLVVSGPVRGAYARPLVAVEVDPSARNLIELTCRIATVPGADSPSVRIVHAYQVPFADWHRAGSGRSGAYYARQSRQAAQHSLTKLLAALRPHPCELKAVVRSGDPPSAITREADRYHADLVAVGTHGRSGIAHVLLGSVAEWLVTNMRRDVLVARPVRFTFVPP